MHETNRDIEQTRYPKFDGCVNLDKNSADTKEAGYSSAGNNKKSNEHCFTIVSEIAECSYGKFRHAKCVWFSENF